MTLPPHKIGDKGQRFILQLEGWPEDGWNNTVYGNDSTKLKEVAESLTKAPGCTRARIAERLGSSTVYTYIK